MEISKIREKFSSLKTQKEKDKLFLTLTTNAKKKLENDPDCKMALLMLRDLGQIETEMRVASRMKIGGLWWETFNFGISKFHAFKEKEDSDPVGHIFMSAYHTGADKDVYSLHFDSFSPPKENFAHISDARNRGSQLWSNHIVTFDP